MKTISSTRLKKEGLALLDNMGPEGVLIIKNGKLVAKLVPIFTDCTGLIGSLRGKIKVKGDILSTGCVWSPLN